MILGASYAQLNAIKRASVSGIKVLATDYSKTSIGKMYADEHAFASTFDVDTTLKVAKDHHINGIMTTGTDQPVLTVSKIAQDLNLPSFLSIHTAYQVTHKKAMKKVFIDHNIPTVDYRVIDRKFSDDELKGLIFPVVVKPLDSQGQRGIYKLSTIEEIRRHFHLVLKHSREQEIMVESYYENNEITISGWVKNGQEKILTVTDRVTFQEEGNLGICLSHEFPSKHLPEYIDEIKAVTHEIVKAFKIKEGPIYFQMFIGEEGLKVNEIACRIGGAYEDEAIPVLTGVDILQMVIDYSIGKEINYTALDQYDMTLNNLYASIQLFFLNEGVINTMTPEDEIKKLEGIASIGYHYKVFEQVRPIENATARAGYAIVIGESQEQLKYNLLQLYDKMQIVDNNNHNMVIHS
ncbi:MAG: carboxylate--amine ligase [Firmicutes bacterium HGW-Firmicutes-7]|nr:MAG: carboxylate--amine ligase [Firmicutes bacterium HGW-Firmicutes-7]